MKKKPKTQPRKMNRTSEHLATTMMTRKNVKRDLVTSEARSKIITMPIRLRRNKMPWKKKEKLDAFSRSNWRV